MRDHSARFDLGQRARRSATDRARSGRPPESRPKWFAGAVALCAALLVLLGAPHGASARQSSELTYSYEQVWGTAIRLLRVDYGFPIQDRDEAIGYVLFDYQDHGRSYQGSIEIIRADVEGRAGVRVVAHIPSMPSYIERMILDRLRSKLRDDFGVPVAPPAPRPAEPPRTEERQPSEGDAATDEESDRGSPPAGARRRGRS